MFLLDTCVIFAAVYQAHLHHEAASRFLANTDSYAVCGLTQIGAFRLLLTDAAMHGCPLEAVGAHIVLAEITESKRHKFLSCPPISKDFVGLTEGQKAAFDDYLIQIAHAAGCKLATLDRRLVNRWPEHAFLIQEG